MQELEVPVPEIELRAGEKTSFNYAFPAPTRVLFLKLAPPLELLVVKIGRSPRSPKVAIVPSQIEDGRFPKAAVILTNEGLTIELENRGEEPVVSAGRLIVERYEPTRLVVPT